MVGRASVGITEQIRQASDIADLVSSYLTLKRSGKHFKALCPFHREKTPSFQVNVEIQIFKCFGCGVGGDVFKFVQLRENVGFLEARAILAAKAGISLQDDRQPGAGPTGPSKTDIERVNHWACRWFQRQLAEPGGRAVREYIEARGISEGSIDRFALGYAPDSWDALGRAAAKSEIPPQLLVAAGLTKKRQDSETAYAAFRNRLIFPIRDVLNRTIGFGGRALGDDPAKYLNTAQNALFDKSRSLYGADLARQVFDQQSRTAVVVEGYTDCVLAHQHGFGHTVATLGTALTVEHVRLLKRYVDTVILVFDSDQAGQRAADQSLRLFMAEHLDIRLANVPEAKDPAELLQNAGAGAFEQVLTSASDALEFKWRQLVRQYQDQVTGPGRRRAVEEFLQLIAHSSDLGACDPIQRGLRLNQVGKLLGLSHEEVIRQLRIISRRSARASAVGRSASPDSPAVAGDAASAAMQDLLEVLLNEPSYYASIESEFDLELITDSELREIARAAVDLARDNPDFGLPELISRFESVQTAQRIVALQTAGEQGGNYAARIEGAMQRLQQVREQHRIGDLTAGLRRRDGRPEGIPVQGSPGPEADSAAADDQSAAQAVAQRARQMHHFAAGRHLSASLTGRGEPRPSE